MIKMMLAIVRIKTQDQQVPKSVSLLELLSLGREEEGKKKRIPLWTDSYLGWGLPPQRIRELALYLLYREQMV